MSASKIRIGVVGVGLIGKAHLQRYAGIEGAEVVAAADINKRELVRVAEQYGIPDTYTGYRRMLERDDIQAVDVCLHNNLHAPVSMAALEAGKHVFCEKPIAGSYRDGLAMLETARRCDRKLSIQLSTLFAKETKAARRLIEEGRLGKIYHARSSGFRRRGRPFVDGYGPESFVQKAVAGGGALFDMGVYHIAQMLFLLSQPKVVRINGKIYQETGMDRKRRKSSGYDVEELAMGLVRFVDDITMSVVESWAVHLDAFEGSAIVGSEGGIRLNPFGFYSTVGDMEMNATFNLEGADWRWHRLNENEDAYDAPQDHWIAALQGRTPLLPTAELALQAMLISEGIYLSNKLGREVAAEEVEEQSVSTALNV